VCILLVFLTYVYRDARFKECKVCTKEPNIFWCPVRNVPRVTFLTPRILRWLLDFGFVHPQPTLLLILVQCTDIFILFVPSIVFTVVHPYHCCPKTCLRADPFSLRKITTDSHIFAYLNMVYG